jgi:hypothetical protein
VLCVVGKKFPIEQALSVEPDLQPFKDACEDAAPTPVAEMVVHRLPWAESSANIAPGRAGAENPENAVEERSSIAWRTSRPSEAKSQERLDQRPLLIRKLVAFHW